MSRICGIITEYNPFHNGHKYQLDQARKVSGASAIVVVMSGNFVQRGEPAIIDKFVRTRAALLGGADVVLEIPSTFSTRSAEGFGAAGVYILAASGIVNSICFGCETDNIPLLSEIAKFLTNESDTFKSLLKKGITLGKSFPAARADALSGVLSSQIPNIADIIGSPNNILGIEYLKAIEKYKLPLTPFGVERKGASHHSKKLEGSFASATALRNEIHKGNLHLGDFMPADSLQILKNECSISAINHINNFSAFFHYISLFNPLHPRLAHGAKENFSITDIIEAAKTKNITHTALRRAALHTILQLPQNDLPEYIRILGFKRSAEHLVKQMHKSATLPIITNAKNAPEMLVNEIKATELYWLALKHKNVPARSEFSSPMVIL